MDPVMWWWRWWFGGDPNRDRRMAETLGPPDEQRQQIADLTEQLHARDAELEALRTQLTRARMAADEIRTMLTAELDQARAESAELHRCADELTRANADLAQLRARVTELEERSDTPPDPSEAAEVLGARVTVDDLTLVDGVGPKIAGVLADAGIGTWRALGDADVEQLRGVLEEAGARYRMHDPSGWPAQARLLAEGRWREFKELTTS